MAHRFVLSLPGRIITAKMIGCKSLILRLRFHLFIRFKCKLPVITYQGTWPYIFDSHPVE